MIPFALLLKILLPPVLVALMSLAARRWGPTVGGLILGLPWMTGPVLYFLGLDKGVPYLVAAAVGAELAVWGIAAFILCFGFVSRFAGWPVSLLAAASGYATAAVLTQSLDMPLGVAAMFAMASLDAAYLLLPLPTSAAMPGRSPAWDIPARMAATFALVSVIVVTTDVLGPQRSGLLASFPVILTVIGVFTLRLWGRDATLRVLRGVAQSLQAFVVFFAVVGFGAPVVGQAGAYALASMAALVVSGALIAANNRKMARASSASRKIEGPALELPPRA